MMVRLPRMRGLSWLRLIVAGLLLANAGPGANAAGRGASDPKPFQIYMIQWRGPTETDRGFTEYFEQEGIPATFIVRNADRKADSISAFVKEIKELQPDLVYVWGGAAPPLVVGRYDAVDPTHHIVDIPVVACMVADPIELGVVPSWESSGRNVTGTSHVAPLDVQVRAMQAYAPLHHLAVIYNTTEPGPGVVVAKLKALSEAFGFRLSTWSVPLDAEGKPRPDSLPELVRKVAAAKPDFLYLGPDSFLGANREIVTEAALEQKAADVRLFRDLYQGSQRTRRYRQPILQYGTVLRVQGRTDPGPRQVTQRYPLRDAETLLLRDPSRYRPRRRSLSPSRPARHGRDHRQLNHPA